MSKPLLVRILAIVGTVLVWCPIAAPIIFAVASLGRRNFFRLDYLMPAELFLFFLAGGILLLAASALGKAEVRIIRWGFGVGVVILVVGQILAVLSGLAAGNSNASEFWMAVVMTTIIIYSLSVMITGVGGILLFHRLLSDSRNGK